MNKKKKKKKVFRDINPYHELATTKDDDIMIRLVHIAVSMNRASGDNNTYIGILKMVSSHIDSIIKK